MAVRLAVCATAFMLGFGGVSVVKAAEPQAPDIVGDFGIEYDDAEYETISLAMINER